jgi:ubiquinone/menaquinone biosynthesis C-methylase UbiE
MGATNYDEVAPSYDQRYQRHAYPGIEAALNQFVGPSPQRVLELGCGTGHWLAQLSVNGQPAATAEARGELLTLHSRLHLFATSARRPA